MAVAIERRLNRGMTQLRLDVLRVGAVGDQETRISVAEVMEAHPADGIAARIAFSSVPSSSLNTS